MRQWDCGLVVVHGGASVGLEIKLGELMVEPALNYSDGLSLNLGQVVAVR
jgi:hypothetical protein